MAKRKTNQIATSNRKPITMDQLFRPIWEDELPNGGKIYRRILSDSEIKMCSLAALTFSNVARKKIKDPESPEYIAIISPLKECDRNDLVGILKGLEAYNILTQVMQEIEPVHQPVPEDPDPSGEMRREVEDKRDEEYKATQDARQKEYEKRLGIFEEELKTRDDETLLKLCLDARQAAYSNQAHNDEYSNQRLYVSCFKDKERTVPYFDNISFVRELNPKIKDRLNASYIERDIAELYELGN